MNRFNELILTALRSRSMSVSELTVSTGVPVEEILAERPATDDEKRSLCAALQLKTDFVLSLPETFDDGKPVVMIRKKPLTNEEQIMLKRFMDFLAADLIPTDNYLDEDDLYG